MSLYMKKLDSGKAYQGGESIFPDFGRIGRTGLENANRVVSHYKTADFARTMFGSLPAENSERLMLAIKADADTVQHGATPPSVSESQVIIHLGFFVFSAEKRRLITYIFRW